MNEYPKIETLYERDEQTHKLKPGLTFKNPVYDLIKLWQFTEKIDGTNIRAVWTASVEHCSVRFAGRTDNAHLPPRLLAWLQGNITVSKLLDVFPFTDAVIYGEGYGAGIQKGGGYGPEQRLAVFDVLVDGKWWLSWENVIDVAGKLGLDTVPYIGDMTLAEATSLVMGGMPSKLNGGAMKAEGVVGRTCEALFDKKGARLIVKLKTKDFGPNN